MAIIKKPLTATEVKEAKPIGKEYILTDGQGLILRVSPKGSKIWIFNYSVPITKKRTNFTIGAYPTISLAQARTKREELRALLAQGIDPQVEKQRQQEEADSQIRDTFYNLAESYFGGIYQQKAKNPETREKNWARLENHIFPYIGDLHVSNIKVKLLVDVYDKVADRSNTLKKLHQLVTAIMDHAITKGVIESHNCHLAVNAQWAEIDLGERLWHIPRERMKGQADKKRSHTVPLSSQAVKLLSLMRQFSGSSIYVFRGRRANDQAMSKATVNTALKRNGYKDRLTAHGIRAFIKTFLASQKVDRNVSETVLSHLLAGGDDLENTYNRYDYLEERKPVMQMIGDYCEQCGMQLTL
ncbi:integrase [Pasteurellaceae bacterium Orientalotternb1]|nr:integrase [Pasteurellaceae bacterium Orientalotternb1]